jgi:nitrate reductase delta subunit
MSVIERDWDQESPWFSKFHEFVLSMSIDDLEESYTRTFDLNPVCSPDIGWHLFGEDYNRGLFLARLRREMRRIGIEESCQLPDHLSHVLLILSGFEINNASDFATACVIPALEKMDGALDEKSSDWLGLVRSVLNVLKSAYLNDVKETADV